MNYKKIYNDLVTLKKLRSEEKNKYYESHHIKPKCFGDLGDGRELSEFIGIPMSTIRSYLNGSVNKPEWFHYERINHDS